MVIKDFVFNIKLTPLTVLKVKQLAKKNDIDFELMSNADFINFLIASFSDKPDMYLSLSLEEAKELNKEISKNVDFKNVLSQLFEKDKSSKK